MRKWLFKWLGLNDLLSNYKKVLESNIELVNALVRHQTAVENEYKELKDRVEKLEKELADESN